MNKRTVNISSLVLLLCLLCFIAEMIMYYLIPNHFITLGVSIILSLLFAHFFLETSLTYEYNFLHSCCMVISTFLFTSVIYFIQPNQWIHYDLSLVLLILVNWLCPFLYCCIRDLYDRGPRFSGYHPFFHHMCALFTVIYVIAIAKQYFLSPIVPPYKEISFGAHNFVPFMATATHIEKILRSNGDLFPILFYIVEMIMLSIPFGFFVRIYLRGLNKILRCFLFLLYPLALELVQYALSLGRSDIDDYVFSLIGIGIGILLFHITNSIFQSVTAREFMMTRSNEQRNFY